MHLITSLSSGGAEAMLLKLLQHMDRRDFDPVVVSLVGGGLLEGEIRALGVAVHSLNMTPGRPGPLAILRLVRLIRRYRPQVLQSWLYHADLLSLIATRIAAVDAYAWNIRCAEVDFAQYSPVTRLTVRMLARLSGLPDAVVVNSREGRTAHEAHGYRPRRWEFLPNGFNTQRFSPDMGPDMNDRARIRGELGIAADAPVMGMVARFDPMKDFPSFLRAAKELQRSLPDVHVLLAGRGVQPDNPAFRALLPEGLRNLHALGERSDLPALYRAMDLSVLSSYSEGFPNVVGEAMSSGVPCVVTDVGDAALIVGDTGFVVPPRSAEALAGAMLRFFTLPPQERRELGIQARTRVQTLFGIEEIAIMYGRFYRDLLQHRKP